MIRARLIALAAVGSIALVGCTTQPAAPRADALDGPSRIYDGYSGYHRTVTTAVPEAQAWFDQGIQLLYGFNHDEAIRSFHRAAQIDPDCAMAWWGVAYARGLHINNPQMSQEQSKRAYEASRRALERVDKASPVEQALIHAVAKRYAWPAPEDRRPLDEAYADAMGEAYRRFHDDADLAALYAESLMNLQPWDLWTHEGAPKGRTLEIVEVLEHAMALNPRHPGANHFYIHAVEASLHPDRALAAADRLQDLVPGSGHLVHMPSHIYIRTGRYAQAADANERAIAADERYFAIAPTPDFYSLYFAHNVHFLAYAAMMEGRYRVAIDAARKLEREIPPAFLRDYVTMADGFMPTALHVLIRFGKWDEVLAEPEPPAFRLVSRAQRHYARAVALAARNRTSEAREELARLDAVIAQVNDDWTIGQNSALSSLAIARATAEGEILFREGHADKAFDLLRKAVAMEEQLTYDEPPGWMQPVRHALGALLLADGRAAEAERVYRADLARHPNNGWSLLGLEQALRAQHREDAADAIAADRARAWTRADVRPVASCYCHPDASR